MNNFPSSPLLIKISHPKLYLCLTHSYHSSSSSSSSSMATSRPIEVINKEEEEEEHIFRSHVPTIPVPDNITLPEFVLEGAENYASKVAIVEASTGKEYTYGEIVKETRRFTKALTSLGIRKGHVVVVVLPNVALYPVVVMGIMMAGGVFSGANPQATPAELGKQVVDAEARIVITNASTYDKVKQFGVPVIIIGEERVVEEAMFWDDLLIATDRAGPSDPPVVVNQSDLCALPYSSGTTGTSKGVMLTHRNLVANLCSSMFGVPEEMIGQVTTLGLIPFFHIYGTTGICCSTLRNKGKVVVMSRFDLRSFMAALIDHEVTFAPIVPAIMLSMVKNPVVLEEFDLSKLRLKAVMTAAAPLAPELLAAFEKKFSGVLVNEAYGLTEHSCITLTHCDPKNGRASAKKNSVGFILPNLETKFVDPETGKSLPKNTRGEICVRSQCVMKGYYKNLDETNRTVDCDGWLHTGDIGYIDDDGDVFVVDRIKELIKYKGFQVAPAELEAVLLSHPSVLDAAVFPIADEEAGEIPSACVVVKVGAQEDEDDIMEYVASNVASYKRIRVLQFVDSIPKSNTGKIMRRVLKETMSGCSKVKNSKIFPYPNAN